MEATEGQARLSCLQEGVRAEAIVEASLCSRAHVRFVLMPLAQRASARATHGPSARRGVALGVCFSPQADFVVGAAGAGVGVETLRRVRARRELIVGTLPLLFGVHQLVEGFVRLGLRGHVSRGLGDAAKEAYIIYAHAVLPAIVPLGFMLLEPDRRRSRVMMAMACVGALMGCTSPVAGHRVSSRSTRAGSLYRLHDTYPKRRPHRAAVRRRDVRAGADLELDTCDGSAWSVSSG